MEFKKTYFWAQKKIIKHFWTQKIEQKNMWTQKFKKQTYFLDLKKAKKNMSKKCKPSFYFFAIGK